MSSMQDPAALKQTFDRDGFVALRGFLSREQLEQVHGRMERYVRELVPLLASSKVMYEDKSRPETLKQMQDVYKHDPFFGRLAFGEQFLGLAELLLGGPVRFDNVQWFNKPPQIGSATPPHQDGYYWMLKPNEGLTMWLALDPVDEGNGCVRYVPGSHRRGVRPHQRTTTLGFSQGISGFGDADRAAEVAIHAQPGDLLVHHALTIHRADPNRSDRSRRAMGFTYFAWNVREDAEAKAAYHKALVSDLTTQGKL